MRRNLTNRFSASVSPTFSLQNDENKHALSIVVYRGDDESLYPSENAITPLEKWKLFENTKGVGGNRKKGKSR